jgi:hypothetical protein
MSSSKKIPVGAGLIPPAFGPRRERPEKPMTGVAFHVCVSPAVKNRSALAHASRARDRAFGRACVQPLTELPLAILPIALPGAAEIVVQADRARQGQFPAPRGIVRVDASG